MNNHTKTELIAAQHSVTSYKGPLPPATDFAKYEQTLPGAAEMILLLAEKEAEHRRSCDVQYLDKSFQVRRRGQTNAFIVAVLALVIAGVCVGFGYQYASIGLAVAACVGLATAYVKKEKRG